MNCKGHGKVTCMRPFLLLDKLTFDTHVNVFEKLGKGTYQTDLLNLNGLLRNVLKVQFHAVSD